MKLGSGRIVIVLLILVAVAMPVVGQTLSIANYEFSPVTSIPLDGTTGIDGVALLHIEFNAPGGTPFIGKIELSNDDGTAVTGVVKTGGVRAFLWSAGSAKFQADVSNYTGEITIDDVALDTNIGGGASNGKITLTITNVNGEVTATGGRDHLWIAFDFDPGITTPDTIGFDISEIKYGGAAGGTGTSLSPTPLGSTTTINDYVVTYSVVGITASPNEEEGFVDVELIRIDLGSASDNAVTRELQSVTLDFTGTGTVATDITPSNVRLHVDGNGNNLFDDAITDPAIGVASPADPTTITTTLLTPADWQFSNAVQSFFIVVNIANPAGVGDTIAFQIANPSTDIAFRDTVADGGGRMSGEYLQIGYITSATTGPTTNYIVTIDPETVADVTPPQVTGTTPADVATGISRDVVIQVNFSEAMDTMVPTDVTVVGSASGAYDLSADGVFNFTTTAFTFDLTGQYDYSETVTVTVDGAVEDTYVAAPNFLWQWLGADPAADYSFSFTIEDPTPPEVTSSTPAAGATGVLRTATVEIVFNEAMNLTTLIDANFDLTDPLAASVPGTFGVTGDRTITFAPTALLDYETVYTVNLVSANIFDMEGTSLADWVGPTHPYSYTFTTEVATPPEVTSTTANAGTTGVARDVTVEVVFSEAMNVGTLIAANFDLTDDSAVSVPGTFAVVGDRTITFTPDVLLDFEITYTVQLTSASIFDTEGTSLADWVGPTHPYTFTFTTVVNVPPTVLATIPADASTDISIGTSISVVFSEVMDEATVLDAANFWLTVTGAVDQVAGVLTYTTEANTVTFAPDTSLGYSTSYTGTVTTGMIDTDGAGLAANHTFSFTTVSAAASLSFTDIIVANNRLEPGSTDPMRIFIETPAVAAGTDVVTIQVYTSTGRRVTTLTTAGETYDDVIARQPIVWDGTNGRGQALGPGLYFLQVSSDGYRRALRIMIVR